VFRFFPAQAEGDSILLYAETFTFPRQAAGEQLCLADFVAPRQDGRTDYVALFVVTCGEGVLELSARWREAGQYFKSHALQSLAIESAEALAELLHERIRSLWKIPSSAGLRVSFGYPACPALEDQAKLFRLLEPERHIGVRLSEGFMMSPEASVSALVFHHPNARYFAAEPAAIS
jgi:5-methyltetrahydrofolate--homocysteine methyltransferase